MAAAGPAMTRDPGLPISFRRRRFGAVEELADGAIVPVAVAGNELMIANVEGTLLAYRDTCAGCGAPLHDGDLRSGALSCRRCERSYFLPRAGRSMDDDGLLPEALEEAIQRLTAAGRRIKFLYTVPNYQNPAGVTLAAERRPRILEICQAAGLLIIEDNPYGLLGFDGDPIRSLRADDPEGVVYLGTFSKTFAPGVRVGWAAAPPAIRDKLVLAAESAVLCHSSFSQLVVREYLATQPWQEQVKDFRELYRRRRDAMLDALSAQMPDGCRWTIPAGGF